jgi:hypothetical protein
MAPFWAAVGAARTYVSELPGEGSAPGVGQASVRGSGEVSAFLTLRHWERLSMIQHRRAQLMQCREGELHFRLHANHPRHPAPRGPPGQVVQQHGLAYAGLTAYHQCSALTGPYASNEPVKYATFAQPVR